MYQPFLPPRLFCPPTYDGVILSPRLPLLFQPGLRYPAHFLLARRAFSSQGKKPASRERRSFSHPLLSPQQRSFPPVKPLLVARREGGGVAQERCGVLHFLLFSCAPKKFQRSYPVFLFPARRERTSGAFFPHFTGFALPEWLTRLFPLFFSL